MKSSLNKNAHEYLVEEFKKKCDIRYVENTGSPPELRGYSHERALKFLNEFIKANFSSQSKRDQYAITILIENISYYTLTEYEIEDQSLRWTIAKLRRLLNARYSSVGENSDYDEKINSLAKAVDDDMLDIFANKLKIITKTDHKRVIAIKKGKTSSSESKKNLVRKIIAKAKNIRNQRSQDNYLPTLIKSKNLNEHVHELLELLEKGALPKYMVNNTLIKTFIDVSLIYKYDESRRILIKTILDNLSIKSDIFRDITFLKRIEGLDEPWILENLEYANNYLHDMKEFMKVGKVEYVVKNIHEAINYYNKECTSQTPDDDFTCRLIAYIVICVLVLLESYDMNDIQYEMKNIFINLNKDIKNIIIGSIQVFIVMLGARRREFFNHEEINKILNNL